jgi:DNA-binding NarL/FixJ family response regulator
MAMRSGVSRIAPEAILPYTGFPHQKTIGSIYTPGVLIVDDHKVTRTTVRSLLKYHSLPVCGEAENGKEAIDQVKELNPDVVLLDIEMPVMNGIQAAYEIRQIAPSTKILFFTIHRNDAVCSARVLGAEGFVAKPDAATELVPALERLLKVC